MPNTEKKGITVKIDADLHAEIRAYLEEHEMTMGDFIAMAADNELHPKIKEDTYMEKENMRTLAFQVPESLFNRIKDYLERNHMTQKQFVLGLIEEELQRDEDLRQNGGSGDDGTEEDDDEDLDEDGLEPDEEAPEGDFESEDEEDEDTGEEVDPEEDEDQEFEQSM